MTNVFISWSGDLSKSLAEELRKWIPSVLQFAKPYFTPNDIEKGSKWGSEISERLCETHVGIICLTRENIEKPWILFEAGALSKDLDSARVCSILFGIDNADLSGPLTTFQTTAFEKSDFRKLMMTINEAGAESKLSRETFDDVFEMWWPKLEVRLNGIMEGHGAEKSEQVRSDREILEEVLSLVRISARRGRVDTDRIGDGVIRHLCELGARFLSEARNYHDRDIFNAVEEMSTAIRYLVKRIESSSSLTAWDNLMQEIEQVRAFLDSKSGDVHDEIPF